MSYIGKTSAGSQCKAAFFALFTVLSVYFPSNAQNTSIDSLTVKGDSTDVIALNAQALKKIGSDKEAAEKLLNRSMTVARRIGYSRGLATAYYLKGYLSWGQGEIASTVSYSDLCFDIADSLHDLSLRAKAFTNLGRAYALMDDSAQVVRYYRQAIDGFKKTNSPSDEGIVLSLLGYYFMTRGDLKNAEDNLYKSLAISRAEDIHYHPLILNIVFLKSLQGKLHESDSILTRFLPDILRNGNGRNRAYGIYMAASNHFSNGNLTLAKTYAQQAVDLYKKTDFMLGLVYGYKLLADVEAKSGNMKEAYVHLARYQALNTSMQSSQAKNRMKLFELKDQERQLIIERQKAELRMADVRIQRNTFWGVSFTLVLAIVGLFLYIRYKNKVHRILETKNAELENSQRLLKDLNDSLVYHQNELQSFNQTLIHQQEEIASQRDAIAVQNIQLNDAKALIERQNEEISKKNEWLENEVRKRTKKIMEYNAQLEQYTFITAHNLRSPVARILGLENLMKLTKAGTPDFDSLLEKMTQSVKELDNVIHDLNRIIEIKRSKEATSEVIFQEELDKIKNSLETEITQANCQITSDFTHAPSATSIKAYIDSIFFNLVSNSVKYRNPERQLSIHVESSMHGDDIIISFRDNGLGIDMEKYRDKVFGIGNRFHDHVNGKGFGLFLVNTQAIALGGHVELTSAPFAGSTFNVYIKKELVKLRKEERVPTTS